MGRLRNKTNARLSQGSSITRSGKRTADGEPESHTPRPTKKSNICRDVHRGQNGQIVVQEERRETTEPAAPIGDQEPPAQTDNGHTLSHADVTNVALTDADDEDVISPPLQQWVESCRDAFVDELMRLEGRCGFASCASEHSEDIEGQYRCTDCSTSLLYCDECILDLHQHLPLHRIQIWEDGHFSKCSLASLGLVVQLGHDGIGSCPVASDVRKDFCVVDVSGHHSVNIRFCNCQSAVEEHIQLLRNRWYPASTVRPRSAFTLDCLDTFHLLTLQGKLSAYDFCLSIERKTDNTETQDVSSRYPQFLLAIRQFRHLRAIKRSGRGHEKDDLANTPPGALAVDCPACPHSSINLPPDWQAAPPSRRWLYTLRLTLDANFRLKNRERQLNHDRPLGDGWGHWVPNAPYMAHVTAHSNQAEPNICGSDLKAFTLANSKRSVGYSSTGIVAVVCARHSLIRRNGLGSLQKGERYVNSDFIVHYTLKDQVLPQLSLSYDIACQYSQNFAERNKSFDPDLQLDDAAVRNMKFVIPKFHLYAHGDKCQANYNLNYLLWSAETDGEDPERWWAHINPVSMSTKIMGPGSRVDTIDDHAAAWNWRKVVGMGTSLLKQLIEAIKMKARHNALHTEYTTTFTATQVASWRTAVQAWERDPRRPNPFAETGTGLTMDALRLELSKEDAASPEAVVSSTNSFLYHGLELEESQRVLRLNLKSKTTHQAAGLQEKRNSLQRRLLLWQAQLREQMPSVILDNEPISAATPELSDLHLPSSLPSSPAISSLRDKERRLRLAQIHDALVELRRLLRIKAGLFDFKITQAGHGQNSKTRCQAQIDRFQYKITVVSQRYCAARQALLALDPTGGWVQQYLHLRPEDARWPARDPGSETVINRQEDTREVSWIWRTVPNTNPATSMSAPTSSEIGQALRLEWSKSYARAARWTEELDLVIEEMRRTLVYLQYKSDSWYKLMSRCRRGPTPEINEGLGAYGYRQAALYRKLKETFANMWKPTLAAHSLPCAFVTS